MMLATTRPLTALTAGDLISRDLISVSQETSLREAGRLLLLHQISGLPVVEPGGTCVGVLSTTDLLRWAIQQHVGSSPRVAGRPYSYIFQLKHREGNGEERVLCTLPLDVCSLQRQKGENVFGSQPHEVPADWQVVNVEQLSTEKVGQFMTPDPVMVAIDTPLAELAQRMVDAHVHRVVVVDRPYRPVGLVSSTDVLAGVARAGRVEAEV
jgi:CBS-domain-containing membrane protein